MRKNDAFRRAAALLAALSITVSLAAPAFAGTYYIDYGDITVTKDEDGKQTVQYSKEDGTTATENDSGEIIITTSNADKTTMESDLEGPAAEDSGFGPVVEDNYQPAPPAQPEDAEEPKDADQPESAEEPKSADQPESAEEPEGADQQESAGQQAQPQQAAPAAAPAASTLGNGFCKNIITVINKAATALKLTLKDVKIDVSDTGDANHYTKGEAALSVQGNGNVEIELDGNNELKSGFRRAGLEKNTSAGTLTLKDDKEAGSGSLKAEGGGNAAGIGGGDGDNGKNITITGGTVTAKGGSFGAGIGGRITENITITGGTVTAEGGYFGAGIGSSGGYSAENITITGSTVTAKGGVNGAGIGGSGGYSAENITITGSTVTAEGGTGAAGIGGGATGDGKNITITGSTVTATGNTGGAGIGGGYSGSGSNVTVSGAARVTAIAHAGIRYNGVIRSSVGATIGNGGTENPDGTLNSGKEIQADISGLMTTGYILHRIYDKDGSLEREWLEPEHPQPNPEDPNAPAEESNEVSLGTPGLHVETLEGDPLPFDARRQGSTLRVTSNTLAARLHGTRQALEALQEQGVEQIQFVTSFKTTTLSVAELLAEGGSWFALEHNGLVSRQLSAAQAESLKCQMH